MAEGVTKVFADQFCKPDVEAGSPKEDERGYIVKKPSAKVSCREVLKKSSVGRMIGGMLHKSASMQYPKLYNSAVRYAVQQFRSPYCTVLCNSSVCHIVQQ